ncbi:MAG: sigma-70 family RNA polymerase sigma factor, partial [Acholeplasmatales bacterium]|nr:sigma-70 family RNA polymerase sigma factor [Acholeplasmatales bacterium]
MKDIDSATLEKFKKGSEVCFNIIYNSYYKLIKQIAFSYTKNSFEAECLVQDTFVALWENKEKIDSNNKNFKYYLTQIVTNKCINYMRSEKRSKVVYLDVEEIDNISNQNESEIEDELLVEYYMNLIKEILDDDTFYILSLHYVSGMKFKDIAKIKN